MAQTNATIYLIRHGRTGKNATGVIRAHSPDKLDYRGIQQMKMAAGKLKGKGIDCVYCSDLPRSKQSGEIISKALGVELEVRSELRTWNSGFAGKKATAVKTQMDWYMRHPQSKPPTGEPYGKMLERYQSFMNEMRDEVQEKGANPVAIVGHGHHFFALNCVLKAGKDKPDVSLVKPDGKPAPGSIYAIDAKAGTFTKLYEAPREANQPLS